MKPDLILGVLVFVVINFVLIPAYLYHLYRLAKRDPNGIVRKSTHKNRFWISVAAWAGMNAVFAISLFNTWPQITQNFR